MLVVARRESTLAIASKRQSRRRRRQQRDERHDCSIRRMRRRVGAHRAGASWLVCNLGNRETCNQWRYRIIIEMRCYRRYVIWRNINIAGEIATAYLLSGGPAECGSGIKYHV